MLKNLAPTFAKDVPPEFLRYKAETFLTCLAVATYLKNNDFLEETGGKIFEEAALNAILKTLSSNIELYEFRLIFGELPNILALNYPAVKNIRDNCIKLLNRFALICNKFQRYNDFADTENFLRLLQTFDNYTHK